ncbi:MAG: hypothetical protein QOI28_2552 [Mycobacterium sp.]|jgi:hypothetical protein|nr:hypothetical protein [Mycobacterium sp.]
MSKKLISAAFAVAGLASGSRRQRTLTASISKSAER